MSKEQSIDITILRTKVTMSTDQPGEMFALANEVNANLADLAFEYPGAKQNELLIFGYLTLLQEKKALKDKCDTLTAEKEKINTALDAVLNE